MCCIVVEEKASAILNRDTSEALAILKLEIIVFTRIDAAAFISFFAIQLRRLFEDGVYSGAAFIQKSL